MEERPNSRLFAYDIYQPTPGNKRSLKDELITLVFEHLMHRIFAFS